MENSGIRFSQTRPGARLRLAGAQAAKVLYNDARYRITAIRSPRNNGKPIIAAAMPPTSPEDCAATGVAVTAITSHDRQIAPGMGFRSNVVNGFSVIQERMVPTPSRYSKSVPKMPTKSASSTILFAGTSSRKSNPIESLAPITTGSSGPS